MIESMTGPRGLGLQLVSPTVPGFRAAGTIGETGRGRPQG